MKRVDRVILVLEGGRRVSAEGGTAHVVKTKTEGKPSARLEVSVPLTAEWTKGDEGRYIKAEIDL